jgi:glutamate-5-semialdehyde dehydrogenase
MSTGETSPLASLKAGDRFVVGDRVVVVDEAMAAAFQPGDRLLAITSRGELLHVPSEDVTAASCAVGEALSAFGHMAEVEDAAIDLFFRRFADMVDDDAVFAPVLAANADDVAKARERGRATGRLELTSKMRSDMAAGLSMWAALELKRNQKVSTVRHEGWEVETWRAPLGVVAFVFEGRPNVFADATGVLRSGNTVVFRIGSDALGTARALRDHVLEPALHHAGLPEGAVRLVDSPRHAAGWALFSDSRVSLAVARGSGPAVDQLGAIARQSGVPVSLHGTGGAWFVVASEREPGRLLATVSASLDRKVCNTVNVVVLPRATAAGDVVEMVEGVVDAARRGNGRAVVHVSTADRSALGSLPEAEGVDWAIDDHLDLGHEWEWDSVPELSLCLADDVAQAVEMFNRHSPQFVLSVISSNSADHELAWARANAPFVGDGFSRWVDGQYALDRPELGLANWQYGRLLARGGVLSGDGVHTLRLRVRQDDIELRR